MKRALGLAASILLHLIFLVLLIFRPILDGADKKFPPLPDDNVIRITDFGDAQKPLTGDGTGEKVDPNELCPDGTKKYNGVGFIYTRETGIISSVPHNLPAYRAGIREWDIFMNPSYGDLPAGPAIIHINRYGVMLTFTVMTQKLCSDTEKTAGM